MWVISNFEIIGHSDISVQITLEGIELRDSIQWENN